MRVWMKILGVVVAASLVWGAGTLSALAEEINLDQIVLSGKNVKQVKSPRQYQLFHVTAPAVPNASLGADHGPLYARQPDGKIRLVANDVIISKLSPEGKIFFVDEAMNLITLDDAGKTKFIASNVNADFVFDKAGKRILVSRPIDFADSTVDLISTDGKEVYHVLPEGNYFALFFTPKGDQILYASGNSGIVSWYLVNTDGTRNRQLTNIGMESGNMTDNFVPVMSTPKNAGFIDDAHFRYMEGPETWVLDITTGKASKVKE